VKAVVRSRSIPFTIKSYFCNTDTLRHNQCKKGYTGEP
jgi:hypothetical protein